MRLLPYILVIVFLLSCSDDRHMRQQLSDLQACNQADSLLTDETLALSLCNYFDKRGSANERMEAHYLLARTYADIGESPKALDEYHIASECADTTSDDCDYRLLTRIHAQSANLFYDHLMPNEMLKELTLMYKMAHRAKDTLSWICAIEWKSVPYDLLKEHDSVKQVLTDAFEAYQRYGYIDMSYNCLPALIDAYLIEGDVSAASKYIEEYDQHIREHGLKETAIYAYYKGNYFMSISQLDSAFLYYMKCLSLAQDKNAIEAAYKGLYELFKKQNATDSVAKYADLCYQVSNERFWTLTEKKLSHTQSLYNYNRAQLLAEQKSKDASENRYRFIISVIITVIIFFLFTVLFLVYRHKKKTEILRIESDFRDAVNKQNQAKTELLQLQRQEYDTLLSEKQKEIIECQEAINSLRLTITSGSTCETRLVNTDIYKRFEYLSVNFNKKVYVDDWKKLREMMDTQLPGFRASLYSLGYLDEKDYHLCILIRLHFTLQQIGILLTEKPQYLSKRRKYLLSKLYHQDGKPELFDKLIKSIT